MGKALAEKGSPDPMYQQWIDTYAGEQFAECVVAVLEITNRVAQGLPAEDREAMLNHYVTTRPVRVDVLGHGVSEGSVAGVKAGLEFSK